jgi:hypothetical protein
MSGVLSMLGETETRCEDRMFPVHFGAQLPKGAWGTWGRKVMHESKAGRAGDVQGREEDDWTGLT